MTDKKLVESILTYCKGKHSYALDNFIDRNYVRFNTQNQCTYLNLTYEGLTHTPSELLELKHLEYLSLNHNYLTYIPPELNYIKSFHSFHNPIFNSKDKIELLFNRGFTNDR